MAKIGLKTFLGAVLTVLLCTAAGAAGFDTELHHRIVNSTDSAAPFVAGDTVMLSYKARSGTQAVSLAFEHENYRTFHTYEKNRHGVFILTVPVPEGADELKYRVIVDGLWTVDPRAPTARDSRGIMVSSITIPANNAAPSPGAVRKSDGSVRFVYAGRSGDRVSLIGDFNRWDPYLAPMEESPVYPGIYETTLRIPEGSRYYRFVVNGREIADPSNARISHNGWGEKASLIP